jgi:hypothetical protein
MGFIMFFTRQPSCIAKQHTNSITRRVRVNVLNATFNNISVISKRSGLSV